MINKNYIVIDKKCLVEGILLRFNLYITLKSNNEIYCMKEKGSYITNEDKILIDTEDVLYVSKSEYINYELLTKNSSKPNAVLKQRTIVVSKQVAEIYTNASKVLDDLFENPESVSNYEASKVVVGEMVDVVSDKEFTIKTLLETTTQDYHIHTHSINVAVYSLALGSIMELSTTELSELGESALLHDIGVSKIDPAIVKKNGSLTGFEFEEIKKHPAYGYTIALKLGIKNRNVLSGIRHHHEKMDGSGYPFGMRGEDIPLFARIIGLCDIFDALTSRRTYKEPMSTFETLKLIKLEMGKQVDTKILQKMILMFR